MTGPRPAPSPCQNGIVRSHIVTLSPCHLVTLSPCHLVTLSPCHLVTLSPARRLHFLRKTHQRPGVPRELHVAFRADGLPSPGAADVDHPLPIGDGGQGEFL